MSNQKRGLIALDWERLAKGRIIKSVRRYVEWHRERNIPPPVNYEKLLDNE